MKKCPFCAEEIQDEAIFCRYCQHELAPASPPAPAPAPITPSAKPKGMSGCAIFALVGLGLIIVLVIAGNLPDERGVSVPGSAPSVVSTGNRANDMFLRLSGDAQAKLLKQTVESAGYRCDAVTRTFYQGVHTATGDGYWSVACRNGRSYSVCVNNDAQGSTVVTDCAIMKTLGGVDCFKTFTGQ